MSIRYPNLNAIAFAYSTLSSFPSSNVAEGALAVAIDSGSLYVYNSGAWVIVTGTTGADRALDNLTSPTSVNQALIPSASGTLDLGTGAKPWRSAYLLNRLGGDVTGSSTSSSLFTTSGAAVNGSSGQIFVSSGNTSGSGASGVVNLFTGDSAGGNSGDIAIFTGSAAGTRGSIFFSGAAVDVGSVKITSVANPTAAQDAATKSYVDSAAGLSSEFDNGNSGASKTINFSNGVNQKITATGTPCVLTFSNPTTGAIYVLKVIQGAGGTKTMTWPGTVKWPAGIAPILSTAAGATDIIMFYYDGTNYFGSSGIGYA